MGEAIVDGRDAGARALIRVAEPFHAVTYYAQELLDLTDRGYRGWWHAYFGYRPAPMGAVSAGTVTAVFYNFAPTMVARAVPGVWRIQRPHEATAVRLERVSQALRRIFGPDADSPLRDPALASAVAEAADLLEGAVGDCAAAGRPLYAAYAELDWPADPLIALWHGCTLVREHRGDSHNVALASSGVDGVECHVLMAGRGHGNRPTITAIRGWTDDEWHGAVDRLTDRGWVGPTGALTPEGHEARSTIETRTDELASEPVDRLGAEGLQRVIDVLTPLVEHLAARGEVSGRWPPEHLIKAEEPSDQPGGR